MTPAAREIWLAKATDALRPVFAAGGYDIPAKVRVSCSWPSRGGTGKTKRVTGQCWSPDASADKVTEIFISPTLDEREEVLCVLAHELIHAAVGMEEGHRGAFKQAHAFLGLAGKCTASEPGEDWLQRYSGIYQTCGDYPHAKLDPTQSGITKQTTRQVKLLCGKCDYIVRASRKCIDKGLPTCPCGCKLEPEEATVLLEGDDAA
jgi:hypothetical protein